MSQKVSRKTAVGDDKDKRPVETPVKDPKKKMAPANEKDKQTEKPAEKTTDKASVSDKKDAKQSEKATDKKEQKNEKADKKAEEKVKEDSSSKGEKSNKAEKPEEKAQKPEQKAKQQNGTNGKPHNGVSDVTLSNGNGCVDMSKQGEAVSDDSDSDVMLVISDQEQDELFPELTYDDTSEDFEMASGTESRSFTRRSQVKATRTPETPAPAPRPNADKMADTDDSKLLKLKDDVTKERKLRSADSPKPDAKKAETSKKTDKPQESPKKSDKPDKTQDGATEKERKSDLVENKENLQKDKSAPVEVMVQVEVEDVAGSERRKADTNFSKSRVKVSPYRRSIRLADQTTSSTAANYTGNNSTMEMDITETSVSEASPGVSERSYLAALRSVRARRSYKLLDELRLQHAPRHNNTTVTEPQRPTGTVVGRKRKPDAPGVELATEASEIQSKRLRLLDRISLPFRHVAASLPTASRNPEIVGINTDLPLTVPVVAVDPETLKATEPTTPQAESKRCVIM